MVPIVGGVTLVDARDEPLARSRRWRVHNPHHLPYASVKVHGRRLYLHRLIMRAGPGQICDHLNRRPLDNRRHNLRLCGHSENGQNSPGRGTSPYRGVHWSRRSDKWRAKITFRYRQLDLGHFDNELGAALAYDAAADALRGPLGYRNFPNLIRADVARQMLEGLSTQIFGVTFRRRSRPGFRSIVCRRGVRKGTKGRKLAFNPAEHNLMSVYDMVNKSFRFINLEQLMLVCTGGKKWRVREKSLKSAPTAVGSAPIAGQRS
jgi:hypothetical protein